VLPDLWHIMDTCRYCYRSPHRLTAVSINPTLGLFTLTFTCAHPPPPLRLYIYATEVPRSAA